MASGHRPHRRYADSDAARPWIERPGSRRVRVGPSTRTMAAAPVASIWHSIRASGPRPCRNHAPSRSARTGRTAPTVDLRGDRRAEIEERADERLTPRGPGPGTPSWNAAASDLPARACGARPSGRGLCGARPSERGPCGGPTALRACVRPMIEVQDADDGRGWRQVVDGTGAPLRRGITRWSSTAAGSQTSCPGTPRCLRVPMALALNKNRNPGCAG